MKSDTVLIDVNGAPTICYKNALRQRNMRVTHAIADTMRQLVYNRIYKMIGFEQCPQHLPVGRLLIRNHGKICTQHSPESHLFFYQSLLYQPVALINWLLDGHGIRDYDSTKLYSLDELVEKFEPDLCFNSERRGFCIVDLAHSSVPETVDAFEFFANRVSRIIVLYTSLRFFLDKVQVNFYFLPILS
ncbi:unnamed protein product [Gongylonema pulchrum]|uniref:Uncharacterized protein n=1 Tax=Gongylonema pulchrum TaxID=637853 RepID=A0A3P7Q3L2_9BILA|nr:unnamed protein product [Gongylonema pulchrum]